MEKTGGPTIQVTVMKYYHLPRYRCYIPIYGGYNPIYGFHIFLDPLCSQWYVWMFDIQYRGWFCWFIWKSVGKDWRPGRNQLISFPNRSACNIYIYIYMYTHTFILDFTSLVWSSTPRRLLCVAWMFDLRDGCSYLVLVVSLAFGHFLAKFQSFVFSVFFFPSSVGVSG